LPITTITKISIKLKTKHLRSFPTPFPLFAAILPRYGESGDRYMATPKQIEANRRNALKSTGPRTPEGKAAVSMNALKHGLRARTVVLPSENPEEFHQLCDDLEAEWQPKSRTEQFYVEQMAVSQWKLNRMEIGEVNVFTNETQAQTQLPMLDRLWQAQFRLERSYARAQRDLERLQKSRRRQGEAPSVSAGAPAAASACVEPSEIRHPTSEIHQPKSNIKNPTSGLLTFPSASPIIDPPQSRDQEETSNEEVDPV
jgi:hypothetical protein